MNWWRIAGVFSGIDTGAVSKFVPSNATVTAEFGSKE
jgi:hypothetical protein